MPECGRDRAGRAGGPRGSLPGRRPPSTTRCRARLYARLAGDLIAANEVEQGERVFALCDEAAAAARRAGDRGALAIALLGHLLRARSMGMRPAAPGASAELRGDPRGGGGGRRARVRRRDPVHARHEPASRSASRRPSRPRSTASPPRPPRRACRRRSGWPTRWRRCRATVQGRFAEGARGDGARPRHRAPHAAPERASGCYAEPAHHVARVPGSAGGDRAGDRGLRGRAPVRRRLAAVPRARPARLRRRGRGPRRVPEPARGRARAGRARRDGALLPRRARRALRRAARSRARAAALRPHRAAATTSWSIDGCQTPRTVGAAARRARPPVRTAGGRGRGTSRPRSGSAGAWARRRSWRGRRACSPACACRMHPDADERERIAAMLAEAAQSAQRARTGRRHGAGRAPAGEARRQRRRGRQHVPLRRRRLDRALRRPRRSG